MDEFKMNRDDIIRMAREAGLPYEYDTGRILYLKQLERFAADILKQFEQGAKMMDIDTLIGRLIDLEGKYYELQSKYQTLIHQYEELKASHEDSTGHRDRSVIQYDPFTRHKAP